MIRLSHRISSVGCPIPQDNEGEDVLITGNNQ